MFFIFINNFLIKNYCFLPLQPFRFGFIKRRFVPENFHLRSPEDRVGLANLCQGTKKSGQGGRKFRCRPVIFRAKIFERRKEKKGREKEKKGRKKTETRATTYSPAKRIAVPSAREGLTAGFGMGPGGPPPLLSPVSLFYPTSAAVMDASTGGAKAKSFRCSFFVSLFRFSSSEQHETETG